MAFAPGPKLILWINPGLLYPARVSMYLTEKPLPESAQLTTIRVDPDPVKGWTLPPGADPMPQPTLPCLRVEQPEGVIQFIHESAAIVEYLEDMFPRGRDVRGDGPLEKAKIRDVAALASKLALHLGIWVYNSSEFGVLQMPYPQSDGAARFSRGRVHGMLDKVENWVTEWGCEDRWISGTAESSVADFALLGVMLFYPRMYGLNLLKDHPKLQSWWTRCETQELAKGLEMPPEWLCKLGNTIREELQ